MDIKTRFLSKVQKDNNACWIWLGAKRAGRVRKGKANYYGAFGFNGKTIGAHVASYLIFKREIAKGLEIDHLCRKTLCVNPEHLEAVTHSVNCKRGTSGMVVKIRGQAMTHCKRGHEFKEGSYYLHNGMKGCKQCQLHNQRKRRQLESALKGGE